MVLKTQHIIIILVVVLIVVLFISCVSSCVGYYFSKIEASPKVIPIKKVEKPAEITLDNDPNLIYNYTIESNNKVLMAGKISSETFINNINTGLVASGISTIIAKVVPTPSTTGVIEHYKIVVDSNTYYLTTNNEDMMYVLMLILPDYTPTVNTIISTKQTSNLTITPGMKTVSLSKLLALSTL